MSASNQSNHSPSDFTQRHASLIAFALICIATTGYFLGLSSPMTSTDELPLSVEPPPHSGEHDPAAGSVIPATSYAEMAGTRKHSTLMRSTLLSSLVQQPYDLLAKIEVNENDKLLSLSDRETRRAFNGAPPTVPHPIDQLDPAACMACHGEGLQSKTLQASKMPHPYYSSCTQCHVEQQAKFALASDLVD
jgi:cytochrome c-type protein NapB